MLYKIIGIGSILGLVVAFSIPKTYQVKVTLSPESGKAGGNNMAAGELGYYLESLEEMTDEFVCPGRFEKKVCQNIFSECGEKNGLSDLILRAEQGDEAADAIVKKIIRKIAVVIANTVLMLNSEMVILGGDSEIFTEENIVEIKKILEKVCPFVPEVVTSKLGADAPIIGGIKVALDYAEEQIIMLWKS